MTFNYHVLAQCGVHHLLREILANQGQHNLLTAIGSRENPQTNNIPPPSQEETNKQKTKTQTNKKEIITKFSEILIEIFFFSRILLLLKFNTLSDASANGILLMEATLHGPGTTKGRGC